MSNGNKQSRFSYTHQDDERLNNPTEELRNWVDDKAPDAPLLYPRDTSLDPQLVWKGKDAQDARPLSVPVVPIFVQEKIHPEALVREVMLQSKAARGGTLAEEELAYQLNLFSDFELKEQDADLDQKVDFYSHAQNWSNRLILGDSLVVMASLAEKENLKGKVQMIYLDPPYGIKFGSNWQVSTRKRDVKDGSAGDLSRQPEQIKAFRDTWELGIHSYLAYLRDRFVVARDLLTESGSIFVQISDENVHLVRSLLDETFGSQNECATIVWKKASPDASIIRNTFNYLLWYGKDRDAVKGKVRQLYKERTGTEGSTEDPVKLALWGVFPNGEVRTLTPNEKRTIPVIKDEGVAVFRVDKVVDRSDKNRFELDFEGTKEFPKPGFGWRGEEPEMERLKTAERLTRTREGLGYRFYQTDYPVVEITNLWEDTAGKVTDMVYVVQTNHKIIERCLLMTTDPGDLVLDPTCGSGTTAYVAEQWGRRWITTDTSRVALALARTRLMTARYPYYYLRDSAEGLEQEANLTGTTPPTYATRHNLREGFVYRRVPHITLKAIANNEEIDTIHEAYQPRLDDLRARFNQAAGREHAEWELPRDPAPEWSAAAAELLAEWWALKQEKQGKIDASIQRRADPVTLFDQPLEDKKRVRVAGPFTVESLSPHRVLNPAAAPPSANGAGGDASAFVNLVLEHLRKAGVQNTKQGERIKFDTLEAYPGAWIQAAGEYTDSEGVIRRVALSIGPEHGTVPPEQVREAKKEARNALDFRGGEFELLLILGFAFEGTTRDEMKQLGRLTVLTVTMNLDITMGLAGDSGKLKNTGAGNLFMVFGEPDIAITPAADGQIVVELKGLDIYDPTIAQVRSADTDDIACWFIDTRYNEEDFFVRHAYFTGADKPYERLQRSLRADVDEEAWESLYSTTSRPFPRPESGKIAVKVINHYGDEVMQVFDLRKMGV